MLIDFNDCPQMLQDEVMKQKNKYSEYNRDMEIVAVEKWISTPYKDKTIQTTTYVVFTETVNAFETFKLEECSNPVYGLKDVRRNSMIAGDIAGFIRHSETFRNWFKSDWDEATKGNK